MGGMDLKALAGMDPKLLQASGIDPNLLSKMLDPKQLAGMDPKMLASLGIDPKMLEAQTKQQQMDSQMLKNMGIDPKMLGLPDTKTSQAASSQMNDYNKMLA